MSFRPIYGIPRLTQDWGTEQHERETHWTSLFYDLLIVAALNAIAEPFEEKWENDEQQQEGGDSFSDIDDSFVLTPTKHLLLDALLQFVSVVNAWNNLNEYTGRFEDESLLGHLLFFTHCFGVAATTAGCVGELQDNYRVLGVGIIMAKLSLLFLYTRPICFVPRARILAVLRGCTILIPTVVLFYGLARYDGREDFGDFRNVLIATTIMDWAAIMVYKFMKREHNVPLHIQSVSDRIKEVTMVIFGEAIFAIVLRPYPQDNSKWHFYLALGTTLWLIYSLALQEFNITPSEEDHALRRSMFFGYLWFYTQYVKQICLMGASIGIKRAHLLVFEAPNEPVDPDTRRLVAWGFSLTLLSVVMLRSYSMGYGRHPSPFDPPTVYRYKVIWWAALGFACIWPQIVDWTILEIFPATPLCLLLSYGCIMAVIILIEASLSHGLSIIYQQLASADGEEGKEPGELTYFHQLSNDNVHYATTTKPGAKDDADESKTNGAPEPRRNIRESFLLPVAPPSARNQS